MAPVSSATLAMRRRRRQVEYRLFSRGGQKIEFRLPARDIIARFTADWMRSHNMNAAEDLTPEAVADEMQGKSLADVNEVLQAAINVAIDRGQSANILLEDLQAAKAHMYT